MGVRVQPVEKPVLWKRLLKDMGAYLPAFIIVGVPLLGMPLLFVGDPVCPSAHPPLPASPPLPTDGL